jgi:PPOX class probable F420-dependent enzyme
VARIATTDLNGGVHLVPIVFANIGEVIYFVVDRKKKSGKALKRIRNIAETGKASLLADRYSEDWDKLSFLLVHCSAGILSPDSNLDEKRKAAFKLKLKYRQYSKEGYFPEKLDEAVFARLQPEKAVFWQNLRRSSV